MSNLAGASTRCAGSYEPTPAGSGSRESSTSPPGEIIVTGEPIDATGTSPPDLAE
ncbi:MAG: hypothetical protein MI725_02365 [Pirellulales bacterium]|nr:hypothetical protein [Pirellulales bacterium]